MPLASSPAVLSTCSPRIRTWFASLMNTPKSSQATTPVLCCGSATNAIVYATSTPLTSNQPEHSSSRLSSQ
eukprot:2628545-Rhodomonas_salina.1